AFRGWAKEGLLRQASSKRLREDKTAKELGAAATPVPAKAAKATKAPAQATAPDRYADGVTISHPQRVRFANARLPKGDVADYYRQMARWILPEVVRRPLSLLRCPDGVDKPCFFQKHHGTGLGDAVEAIPLEQKSGR